jgi:hypothetical protein
MCCVSAISGAGVGRKDCSCLEEGLSLVYQSLRVPARDEWRE